MNSAVILLGSNLGDRSKNLKNALTHLLAEGKVTRQSAVYETEPWGNTDQPEFYNMVVELETKLDANSLMKFLLDIEKRSGRERKFKWEPRTIDLDILYFNDDIIRERNLIIPHPHLHERRFTLVPLVEILPDKTHPELKISNRQILEKLADDLVVNPIKAGVSING